MLHQRLIGLAILQTEKEILVEFKYKDIINNFEF